MRRFLQRFGVLIYRVAVIAALVAIWWRVGQVDDTADEARRHASDAADRAGYALDEAKAIRAGR